MPAGQSVSRRRLLGALASPVLASAVAGCRDGSASDETTNTSPAPTSGDITSGDSTATAEESTGSTTQPTTVESTTADTNGEGLDLREANVVDVSFEHLGDGRHRFDVTLHHDDAGESGYANWWQVETMLGERLGRRDLAHPHADQPFTRSATVDVPAATTCVVVRGHDQTHGYGGQAIVVNLELDAQRVVQQGADRRRFEPGDCP